MATICAIRPSQRSQLLLQWAKPENCDGKSILFRWKTSKSQAPAGTPAGTQRRTSTIPGGQASHNKGNVVAGPGVLADAAGAMPSSAFFAKV